MINKKAGLIIVMFLLILPSVFSATLYRCIKPDGTVGNETDITASAPDTPQDGGNMMRYGKDGGLTRRSVLDFEDICTNLTSPSFQNVNLTLRVVNSATDESNISAYPISAKWDEPTVTYNTPWTAAGGQAVTDYEVDDLINADRANVGDNTDWFVTLRTDHFDELCAGSSSYPNGMLFIDAGGEASANDLGMFATSDHATPALWPELCCSYTETPPPPPVSFTLTLVDTYDGGAINNFNIVISNETEDYFNVSTTGSITFDNFTGLFDISVNATDGGYFNKTYEDVNVSDDLTADLYQVILYVNASEAITGDKINIFTGAAPLQSNDTNATGWIKLFLKEGLYNISANASGYLDAQVELDLTAMDEVEETVILGTANLTVDAFSMISGNIISDFSVNLTEMIVDYKENKSTTNGSMIFKVIDGSYNLSITAAGFASDHQVITIPVEETLPNVTFSLYTENSINITIYDEETQQIINYTTTTIVFDHNISRETETTDNGTLYKDDLFDGLWDIAASTDFHYQRHYFITIITGSHNTLDIWLLNTSEGEVKTFNIINQRDEPLEDVFMTITNKVNDSYVTVAQKYSDVAGQLNVLLKSTTEYRIMLEADGYTTKTFDLEPAEAEYTIVLKTTEDIIFEVIEDKVSYIILPNSSIVTPLDHLNLSILASSEGGYISYFGLNTTFGGTLYLTNITGSVGGGTASIVLNTSNISGITIDVDHFIKLSGEDILIIHKSYYASNVTGTNYSAMFFAQKYKDDFTDVIKAIVSVLVAVAVIATFAELGVPVAITGIVGSLILVGFSILGWLPYIITTIIAIIIIGMYIIKRGD